MTNDEFKPCNYCGEPTTGFHSGSWECRACWTWRKLDGPAARHWAKVSEEFLSNIDLHDLQTYFGLCDITRDEANTMLLAARKLRDTSKRLIEAHSYPRTK